MTVADQHQVAPNLFQQLMAWPLRQAVQVVVDSRKPVMANSRPAVQLLNQLFSQEQLAQYPTLRGHIEDGGSIFALVEKGVQGLVKDYGVSSDDAHRFLRRANSMALYVRRQFIEHNLRGPDIAEAVPRSGLLSMVQGPSFERLFSPNFDSLCPPQALESLSSPVAYLIELLRWIDQRIEAVSNDPLKLPLHDRRTDLKPLAVDFKAVHQSVSAMDIIVPVLESFIEAHDPEDDLEQAMVDARYPNGLPYYQHWVTLDTVARHHGLSVGDFAHQVDLAFPYFLQAQAWDDDAGRALAHASRLGPYQRTLLTESAAKEDPEEFYLRNFGAEGLKWKDLSEVPFFGERTKLDTPGLEALLSVRGFAPVRSANVKYPQAQPEEPESAHSGSVYLNAKTHPGVHIVGSGTAPSFLHRLSVLPEDVLDGMNRYDRMNRKVRLDQWLALPSEQVDALLVAAINAGVHGGASADDWWITEQVVHALGLYQSLRERYGCTAADFAVFIDGLSIYGRGETLSQFDQIFNGQADYRGPLLLDDGSFPVTPEPGELDLTVARLCSALNIDLKTYAYLAQVIAGAYGRKDGQLVRSVQILSSFYRLVRVSRLLGITPVEGILMLTSLGGEPWLYGVAGVPQINSTRAGPPDVLNLLYAMQACTQWCADRNLEVLWMLQHVSSPQVGVATDAERQFFEQMLNLLPGALFTNSVLLMAGVPALAGANWLDLLTALVDADGLVIAKSGPEAEYLVFARETINDAVRDGLGEAFESERPAIVEKMLDTLLKVRAGQVSVVKECLAVYTGLDSEQAFHVLVWANATVHGLLSKVLGYALSDPQVFVGGRNEQQDPLLALLADVRRRSEVVLKLALSAELLQDYLDYGHEAWLGQTDKHAFTMRTLYYLTSLTHAFELSEQPAQKLLDYLREVSALPSPLTGDALWLAQEASAIRLAGFFNWSVQEVRECVSRIDPDSKILKNLPQLDLMMRVRQLTAHTGMDALTIFLIGTLPEEIDKPAYKEAAEHALLSLSESSVYAATLIEDLRQLVSLTVTVDNTDVVAGKPDEKIIFTVTLKRSTGEPLSGVLVHWSAVLGTIEAQATGTDGSVQVEFRPGKVMGIDTPRFWLDLFEPQDAPTIHVIADSTTLRFPSPLKSLVPLGEVAYSHEVELYATLMDSYGNLGKNSLVQWFYTPVDSAHEQLFLVIRPRQAFTNQEGQTRVFVSSPTGGTFSISVLSEGGEAQAYFDNITFANQE